MSAAATYSEWQLRQQQEGVARQNAGRKASPLAIRQARQLALWAEAMGLDAIEAVKRSKLFVEGAGAAFKAPKVEARGNFGIAPIARAHDWITFNISGADRKGTWGR